MNEQRTKLGWWIVSLVNSRTLKVVKSNIDAVFADGADNAMDLASQRNPCKPGQSFGLTKITLSEKRKACRLHDVRTDQIAEMERLTSKFM